MSVIKPSYPQAELSQTEWNNNNKKLKALSQELEDNNNPLKYSLK